MFPACRGARTMDALPKDGIGFIKRVETRTGVPVVLVGTGPDALDVIDLRD